jgi:hypothetical protein
MPHLAHFVASQDQDTLKAGNEDEKICKETDNTAKRRMNCGGHSRSMQV